jgi:fermentation-respiration switch protein FrsA (DUF1100 family)
MLFFLSRVLAVGVAVAVAVLVFFWLAQRGMMYFPSGRVGAPSDVGLLRAETVTFQTSDGLTLNGWFVPAGGTDKITIVVFNGNAGNRSYRADLAIRLAAEGFSVLLFDYRGFGGNDGSPTEEGLAIDARAARAYVLSRPGIDASRIVYFGESLGSGVAVRLAEAHPPLALVLRSPFTSFVDVGRVHYSFLPVRWLLRDRYSSIDRITRIKSPLLIIAGSRDAIVPASQSRQLFEAALEPKELVMIEGADHNDEVLFAGPRVIGSVTRFVSGLSGR